MIMKNSGGGGGGGEIVQVQGGHILRSTSRKDRHSKVITAKGPRDRRVRLSAHTAIQFYDVQDRLGCDRPSKAVDWLMMKAKNAIDKLSELPPWNPIDDASIADPNEASPEMDQLGRHQSQNPTEYPFQMDRQLGENSSFFPLSSGTQDLCLSLQSVQDSIASSSHQAHHTPNSTDQNQTLFHQGSVPVAFGDDYRRVGPWNGGGNGENIEGCNFNSLPIPTQQFLCQSSVLSQRGPLQSNFFSSIHSWNEQPIPSTLNQTTQEIQQSSISSSRFASQSLFQFRDQPSSSSPNSHH